MKDVEGVGEFGGQRTAKGNTYLRCSRHVREYGERLDAREVFNDMHACVHRRAFSEKASRLHQSTFLGQWRPSQVLEALCPASVVSVTRAAQATHPQTRHCAAGLTSKTRQVSY